MLAADRDTGVDRRIGSIAILLPAGTGGKVDGNRGKHNRIVRQLCTVGGKIQESSLFIETVEYLLIADNQIIFSYGGKQDRKLDFGGGRSITAASGYVNENPVMICVPGKGCQIIFFQLRGTYFGVFRTVDDGGG